MSASTEPAEPSSYGAVSDLPGIGPTKAAWLRAVGIDTIEALRSATTDRLAHVRGVGYPLAQRLKELVGGIPSPGPLEPSSATSGRLTTEVKDPQARWSGDVAALLASVREMVDALRSSPEARGLKPKFMRELDRLCETLDGISPAHPPSDGDQRSKIGKHVRAIRTLLDCARGLDDNGKNHQKVVRQKLKARRKKLGKWIGPSP